MIRNFSLLLFSLFIISACDRDDGLPLDGTTPVNVPDRFAAFLNPVAGLPAGDYTVVAATDVAGESGTYTLTITFDDGEIQVFTGSWTNSGGPMVDPANPEVDFTLHSAGGINITLESSVNTYLLLVNSNGNTKTSNAALAGTDSTISIAASRIDSEQYGAAYYAAIDPNNTRDTLEKWKMANGFDAANNAGRVLEPRFRDTKDLGYGRGIRAWTQADGSLYFFVENFQVRTIPGLEYTAINLDALIADDRQHHFGSNAIEYSTYPYGPGEPCASTSGNPCATTNPNPAKFLKFFTFDATQGDQTVPDHANETRLNQVNLDGRGDKSMPGGCVYCHGGTLRPLRPDGTFRDNTLDGAAGNGLNGDTNAKFQLMEASSFEYWPEQPYTQPEQERIIKEVNKLIYCTYPGASAIACAEYCIDPADTANCGGPGIDVATVIDNGTVGPGEWTGTFAVQTAEGWYDKNLAVDALADGFPDFDSNTFRQDYVPLGWRPNVITGNPPAGADQLFVEVIEPICFVCHSRRGTSLGTNLGHTVSKDIDFSTWDKFISHADLIEQYVYERGVMPLSLRGYNAFWAGDGPELLASFLPNFSHANADGSIDQPGVPVADAGPDRTMPSPARMSGSNSRFANTYTWSIIEAPAGGEAARLTDINTQAALLTTPVDGDYTLRLMAGNGLNQVDQDEVIIKINSFILLEPKDIVFNDIEIFLGGNCFGCHSNGGTEPGIPVWWTMAQPASGTTLYEEVLARVDFNDPEKSPLLRKPAGNQHHGNLRPGFDVTNPADRQNYDLFLNWIMEGARQN